MALPTLQAVEDCGDYYKTVEPFLPQLYELPRKLLDNYANLDALAQLYVETNPFISGAAFSVFLGFIFLVTAEINRNFSQVDRAWSILPAIYNIHFAVWARLAGEPHERTDLVALFSIVWSVRSPLQPLSPFTLGYRNLLLFSSANFPLATGRFA